MKYFLSRKVPVLNRSLTEMENIWVPWNPTQT